MEEMLFYAIAVLGLIGALLGLFVWHKWVLADSLLEHYKKLCRQQRKKLDDLQDIEALLEILSMREGG